MGARAFEASRSLLNVHNLAPLLAIVPDNEISEVDKFCFHPVSRREIQKIVMSLPSNKAPDHDKVSNILQTLSHLVLLAYARLTELNIFLTQSLRRMLSTLWYLVDCFIVLLYGPVHQRRTSPNCKVFRILLQELSQARENSNT